MDSHLVDCHRAYTATTHHTVQISPKNAFQNTFNLYWNKKPKTEYVKLVIQPFNIKNYMSTNKKLSRGIYNFIYVSSNFTLNAEMVAGRKSCKQNLTTSATFSSNGTLIFPGLQLFLPATFKNFQNFLFFSFPLYFCK